MTIIRTESDDRINVNTFVTSPWVAPMDGGKWVLLVKAQVQGQSQLLEIAEFDSAHDANEAIVSLTKAKSGGFGWDAKEFKDSLDPVASMGYEGQT